MLTIGLAAGAGTSGRDRGGVMSRKEGDWGPLYHNFFSIIFSFSSGALLVFGGSRSRETGLGRRT